MSDNLRDQVARLLYREIRETCGGYVEPIADDEPIAGPTTVDGTIDFTDLADAVIKGLELGQETLNSDSAVYRWVSAWFREPSPARTHG